MLGGKNQWNGHVLNFNYQRIYVALSALSLHLSAAHANQPAAGALAFQPKRVLFSLSWASKKFWVVWISAGSAEEIKIDGFLLRAMRVLCAQVRANHSLSQLIFIPNTCCVSQHGVFHQQFTAEMWLSRFDLLILHPHSGANFTLLKTAPTKCFKKSELA